ncbi:MAG: AAA family ATPase [Propionibacteriaceae bacterium]|nr:AAA family ATPase [Propionibacteriaceae bacterium]
MPDVTNSLIDSLLRAVSAAPDDIPLRLHVAELLVAEDRAGEAIAHCAIALQADPANERARSLMAQALGGPAPAADAVPEGGFDWTKAAEQFAPAPDPRFIDADEDDDSGEDDEVLRVEEDGESAAQDTWDVEEPTMTLADVGGLVDVKERLEVSFLAPLRNPEMRALYGKSLRGGLLLYGPPGCGKTYIARAVAGEMGARFLNVTLTDVLDMYVGNSEANLHGLFEAARTRTPCVIFLDELDAIGAKRSLTRNTATRGVVNTLLQEMDGIGSDNEGVYVMAATNAPWDVDPALRRPGRLDRTILVLPPDEPARTAILRHHLAKRPVEDIDLRRLARATDGFTGADLAHICESAAEAAMMASVRSGRARSITMRDIEASIKTVRPSSGAWFDVARNVVEYADRTGEYNDLRAYMKKRHLL